MPFMSELSLEEAKAKKKRLESLRKAYIVNKERNNYPEWYFQDGLRDFNEHIDLLNEYILNEALKLKQEKTHEERKRTED